MTEITDQDRQDFQKWKRLHFFKNPRRLFTKALNQDKIAFVRILLEQGEGQNALSDAVRSKNNHHVKNLILAGVDLNTGAEDSGSYPPLCAAAFVGNVVAARMLIEAGCNINAQSHGFSTSLIIAVAFGQPVVADLLMAYGADPTIRGRYNLTALERARRDAKPFVQKLETYEKEWASMRAPQPLMLPAPAAAALPAPAAARDDGWSYVGGTGCDMVIQKISDTASDTHIKNIFDFAAKRFITEIISNGNAPQMLVEKLDTIDESLLAQARKKRAEIVPQEPGLT